jgi:mRNA interferase MazF
MRRGEVWLADLEPIRGVEVSKQRPVVLISNDHANRTAEALGRGVLTAVPLTGNTERVFPFQILIEPGPSGLAKPSKAQAEQLRALSFEGFIRRLGRLDRAVMTALDEAIRVQLSL